MSKPKWKGECSRIFNKLKNSGPSKQNILHDDILTEYNKLDEEFRLIAENYYGRKLVAHEMVDAIRIHKWCITYYISFSDIYRTPPTQDAML